MQTSLPSLKGKAYLRRLRFPTDLERSFQAVYYERVRPTVRVCLMLLALLTVVSVAIHLTGGFTSFFAHIAKPGASNSVSPNSASANSLSSNPVSELFRTEPNRLQIAMALGVAALNLLTLGLSFHRKFPLFWQPCLALTVILSFNLSLSKASYIPATSTIFLSYGCIIWFRMQRLQLRWMAFQCVGTIVLSYIVDVVQEPRQWAQSFGSSFAFLLFSSVPLLFAWRFERFERFERSEFWTKYALFQERDKERNMREQSEQMLHVLSQAIGGIVHDLGNPLTSVQTGAETLLHFVKDGDLDREMVQEFAEIITDGAKMLNYLRLSLMEQTRVLEGKPIPVEAKPVALRQLVQAGAHYQKPKFASGRQVSLCGDDIEVCVDEMRYVTVFMNLIGNALKYSDGEVRVSWRIHDDRQVLVAIQDQGKGGQGITRAQADTLFVAFGRLENHAQVEGTGLGLLSVRKIAEAHGGEVYIEGCQETPTSASTPSTFSTALEPYSALLDEGFRTAFVTTCPLHVPSNST